MSEMIHIAPARRERLRDYLYIAGGTCLMAFSTNFFYTPAHMTPGGFTGLAIILQAITSPLISGGIPVWLGSALLNIPLILFSVLLRGWSFVRRTFLAAVIFSFWLYLIPETPLVVDDPFLTAVMGGGILGAGLGIVFMGRATTGGTDTLAAIINRLLPHISTARILWVLDGIVILLSAWIFGVKISLYALISVILCSRLADGIISGFRNAYVAYIISEKYPAIKDRILQEMNRGATLLEGRGMYTDSPRPVLFCAVSRKQVVILRDIVAETDRNAFMIITDASEIRGEGFLAYSKEEF